MPSSKRWRTISRQSAVLRAKRLSDFVTMRSMSPFSQSCKSRWSAGRVSFLVPLMPSSL